MKSGDIDENQIVTIVKDCLKCLVYLHGEKIIHRDIKGSYPGVTPRNRFGPKLNISSLQIQRPTFYFHQKETSNLETLESLTSSGEQNGDTRLSAPLTGWLLR
jgi:serine/threonine protein kinase